MEHKTVTQIIASLEKHGADFTTLSDMATAMKEVIIHSSVKIMERAPEPAEREQIEMLKEDIVMCKKAADLLACLSVDLESEVK